MSSDPSVDVHTHLAPELRDSAGTLAGVEESSGRYVIDGEQIGVSALYEARQLEDWLTAADIDRAWVSIPPPFFRQGLQEDGARIWVERANDGLLARIAGSERLEALAYLPFEHPQVALAELDRLVSDERIVGWNLSAGGGSLPLDDARLTPVWDRLEAVGRPVLLHPGSSSDARLDRHYLSNLVGNPVETTVAAAELVFGDVLGTHPDLRPVLVHCGGTVPMLAGRWQRGADTNRPGVGPLSLAPGFAVRRFWVDALAHEPGGVDLAVAVFGLDKVVLGSDWPFPMGLDNPWSAIAHLSPEQRDRIGRSNVASLCGVRHV